MSREVIWTRSRYELVCEQGMLSDEDAVILEEHIKHCSNLEIAMRHNVDVSNIAERIGRMKLIYDEVQREFPDKLDERMKSVYRHKKHRN